MLDMELDVVSHGCEDDDPFLEADIRTEVQSLIEKTMPEEGRCSVDEYLTGEDELPICVDMDSENWEGEFMAQLGREEQQKVVEDDEEVDNEEEASKNKEAIESLEDVQQFLESRGYAEEALGIGHLDT